MSESSLVNRYKWFKAGTTKVVSWLAQTARKARDITNIVPSRRAANDAAKQAGNIKSLLAPDINVKVTTSQLLSLAQVIVDASFPIPDEILRTIRTVIDQAIPTSHSDHTWQNHQHSPDGHAQQGDCMLRYWQSSPLSCLPISRSTQGRPDQ